MWFEIAVGIFFGFGSLVAVALTIEEAFGRIRRAEAGTPWWKAILKSS